MTTEGGQVTGETGGGGEAGISSREAELAVTLLGVAGDLGAGRGHDQCHPCWGSERGCRWEWEKPLVPYRCAGEQDWVAGVDSMTLPKPAPARRPCASRPGPARPTSPVQGAHRQEPCASGQWIQTSAHLPPHPPAASPKV